MKTPAIFTRTLTTNTVSAFDLVRQGWQIVSKIDFVVYKVGRVWNAKDRCAEAWMNRPVITDISSVIPKEDEVDGFDSYISNEDLAAAEDWDARTSKEEQDWFRNRY